LRTPVPLHAYSYFRSEQAAQVIDTLGGDPEPMAETDSDAELYEGCSPLRMILSQSKRITKSADNLIRKCRVDIARLLLPKDVPM
jgi:hypothetical protein